MLTNVGVLRRTRFSFVPWALTFGAFPTFLSWGGWGRDDAGDPATVAITITAGLIGIRSEEHTSELQSLMRSSYAVFCLKKKKIQTSTQDLITTSTLTR